MVKMVIVQNDWGGFHKTFSVARNNQKTKSGADKTAVNPLATTTCILQQLRSNV